MPVDSPRGGAGSSGDAVGETQMSQMAKGEEGPTSRSRGGMMLTLPLMRAPMRALKARLVLFRVRLLVAVEI